MPENAMQTFLRLPDVAKLHLGRHAGLWHLPGVIVPAELIVACVVPGEWSLEYATQAI